MFMEVSFGCWMSDALACGRHGLFEHGDVTHLIGQQQDQLGVEQLALLVAEVAMRVDQGFVEVVARREVTEIALTGFGKVGLALKGHGVSSLGWVQAAVVSRAARRVTAVAMSCAVARASARCTAGRSNRRQRAATCWSGRIR